MKPHAVDTVEQIDAQWLTAALDDHGIDATVRDVTSEPVGTGQMGSCFRLRIDYEAGDGPQRLIVKLPAADPNIRAAGSLGYRCETNFYREFAHLIKARVPQCFLSVTDEANNGFTLLLEDLAPAQAGDQIAGCSIEEARAAAINVAGLHAPTWNSPTVCGARLGDSRPDRDAGIHRRANGQRHQAVSRALHRRPGYSLGVAAVLR